MTEVLDILKPGKRGKGTIRPEIQETLRSLRACPEGYTWVVDQGSVSPLQLWRWCPYGEWMLWYLQIHQPYPRIRAEIPAYDALKEMVISVSNRRTPAEREWLAKYAKIQHPDSELEQHSVAYAAAWMFETSLSSKHNLKLARFIRRTFALEWSEDEDAYIPRPRLQPPPTPKEGISE